jgi:hypothetical protein
MAALAVDEPDDADHATWNRHVALRARFRVRIGRCEFRLASVTVNPRWTAWRRFRGQPMIGVNLRVLLDAKRLNTAATFVTVPRSVSVLTNRTFCHMTSVAVMTA